MAPSIPSASSYDMKTCAIVKTHEIALKGRNRPWFMRRLADNLRRATKGAGVEEVWQGQMLVGLTLAEDVDWQLVKGRIKDCFGVAKFFQAYRLPHDLDQVKEVLPSLLESHTYGSFRITANRADKRFPVRSDEINRDLGTFVKDLSGARVDLTNPDLEIFIDVLPKEILVYFDEVKAFGGLPVGSSGPVAVMLSGGIDSPVAAWNMMKRGCHAHIVHFHSYPLVDNSSMGKAAELAEMLTRYQYNSGLSLVPLAEIQKQIIFTTPPSYRIILYRGPGQAYGREGHRDRGKLRTGKFPDVGEYRGRRPGGRDAHLKTAYRGQQRRDHQRGKGPGDISCFDPTRSGLLHPFRAQASGEQG